MGNSSARNPNKNELKVIDILRTQLGTSFAEENQNHETLLRKLFKFGRVQGDYSRYDYFMIDWTHRAKSITFESCNLFLNPTLTLTLTLTDKHFRWNIFILA